MIVCLEIGHCSESNRQYEKKKNRNKNRKLKLHSIDAQRKEENETNVYKIEHLLAD